MFFAGRPQSRNTKIVLLALGYFFMFGYSYVCYLLPIYYTSAGFSHAQAGLLVSAYYAATLIFRLLLGNVLPRLGFRRFFAIGAAAIVASSLWIVFADTFICALAARFILGAGTAFPQIAIASYQSMAFEEKGRGAAFSLIMAGGLAPMMTVMPVAELLLARGWHGAYIWMPFALTVMLSILTVFILNTDDVVPVAKGNAANPFVSVRECFRIRELAFALLCMLLFSIADAASSFMSAMTASYGLLASYFLSSNAAVGVLVRVLFGKALDRYPRRRIAAPVVAGMLFLLLLSSVSPSRLSLTALGLLFGVGMGLGFPLILALVSDSAPMRLQPQAVSLTWFFVALDFAAVPAVMSALGAFISPAAAFRAVVLAGLAGTVCAESLLRWGRM